MRSVKACPRARRIYVAIVVFVVSLYLSLPVIAGIFRIGNVAGPKPYPVDLHRALYGLGWALGGNEALDGKPRMGWWMQMKDRPWFYGLPEGPSFRMMQQEIRDLMDERKKRQEENP